MESITAFGCKLPINGELLFYKNVSDPDDEGCSWEAVYRDCRVDPNYEECSP